MIGIAKRIVFIIQIVDSRIQVVEIGKEYLE